MGENKSSGGDSVNENSAADELSSAFLSEMLSSAAALILYSKAAYTNSTVFQARSVAWFVRSGRERAVVTQIPPMPNETKNENTDNRMRCNTSFIGNPVSLYKNTRDWV